MEDFKAKFIKKYADIPEGARTEIIASVRGEAYTWRSAKVEIDADTEIGNEILEFLVKLELL